jgi:cation transport ATPase
MPHDNKFYLKLRPTGNTKVSPKLETKAVDLKGNVKQSKEDAEDEANYPTTILGKADKAKNDYISEFGTIGLILAILAVIGVAIGIYKGYSTSTTSPFTFEFMRGWAIWTREKFGWFYNYVLGFIGWIFSYIYSVFVWIFGMIRSFFSWMFMFIPNLFSKGEALAKEAIEKAAEKRADQSNAASSSASTR